MALDFYLTQDQQSVPPVGNFLGTVTLPSDPGSTIQFVYTPGGLCTLGKSDPGANITLTLQQNGAFTGGPITLGGVSYTTISASLHSDGWRGTASNASTTVNWRSFEDMVFPYGNYIFTVYARGARTQQMNSFGGTMILSGPGNGTESVQITVPAGTGSGTAQSQSTQPNFGLTTSAPNIAIPNGPTYNFQQMFYAFTDVDSRAVLWGNLQISGQQGEFHYVAFQWPALGLPGLNWAVINQPSGNSVGTLSIFTDNNGVFQFQFTPTGGSAVNLAPPNPQFTFSVNGVTYRGLPQVTVEGPNMTPNPTAHPSSILWDWGGCIGCTGAGLRAHKVGPPGTDADWSSVAENGQPVTTGRAGTAKSYA